jgi:hypothetical protein
VSLVASSTSTSAMGERNAPLLRREIALQEVLCGFGATGNSLGYISGDNAANTVLKSGPHVFSGEPFLRSLCTVCRLALGLLL